MGSCLVSTAVKNLLIPDLLFCTELLILIVIFHLSPIDYNSSAIVLVRSTW